MRTPGLPPRRTRRRVAALLVCTTAAVLAGCGGLPNKTLEDNATVTDRITAVRLDTEAGGIELRGRDGATAVSVHRKLAYRDALPDGPTFRVENGVLVLSGCGRNCAAQYTVEGPTGLAVTGGTSAGAVVLAQVGQVNVTTEAGNISLDGVAGPVDARTSNGQITGRGLRGTEARVETSNGSVDLEPAVPQNVTATTSNGDVTLRVPAAGYQVRTDTSLGRTDVRIANDPAGRYRLDLSTSNGDITVEPA